jgi:hypothetical protein
MSLDASLANDLCPFCAFSSPLGRLPPRHQEWREPLWSCEVLAVPGIKKDGAGVSIEFKIVPLRDEAGELTGLAAIMRDVTKRFEEMRALKQKLAEATKPSR